MSTNDSNEREMERQLEQHFASGADNVPPTPDLWANLEGRLGEQDPKPLWAGIRDWALPTWRVQWSAAARRGRGAAVVMMAIAGTVGYIVGGLGQDGGVETGFPIGGRCTVGADVNSKGGDRTCRRDRHC